MVDPGAGDEDSGGIGTEFVDEVAALGRSAGDEQIDIARNDATAPTTEPSMMPISGTANRSDSGTRRIAARNSAVPPSANTIAASILTTIGAPGMTIAISTRPSPADSTVPAVDGSTKRLRVSSCISRPAMASDAPASAAAAVRGRRASTRYTVWASVSPPVSTSRTVMSAAPTKTLARSATTRATTPKTGHSEVRCGRLSGAMTDIGEGS